MLVTGVVVVGIVMGFDGSGSVHFGKSYPSNIERETLIAKLKNRRLERNRFACEGYREIIKLAG